MTTDAIDPREPAAMDAVERPGLGWWIGILGGLTVLAFQGFSPDFYAFWTSHVNPLPGSAVMRGIFLACIPIHIFEAVYVHRLAHRLGMHRSAMGWAVQTLLIGFASTLLIRRLAARRGPG
jgi:hypothetical protein